MGSTPNYHWRLPEQATSPPDVVGWLGNLGGDIDTTVLALEHDLTDTGLSGKRVRFGSTVVAVSGTGGVTITYGYTFAAAPVVLAVLGDEVGAYGYLQIANASVTPSMFAARVITRTGQPATGGGMVRINWVALGTAA